jgi:transposase, IS30 family
MLMKYHQLTSGERYMISALRAQGCNQSEIARALGRDRSTVSREVRRNATTHDGHYRAAKAIEKASGRRSRSRRNQQFGRQHYEVVEACLRQQWSPEQISGRLRYEGTLSISHETIYRHIWANKASGGDLYTHLRGAHKQRRKRYGAYDSRGRLAGKRHISERPKGAESRSRVGHWEIDTVMGSGNQHCIVTLVERKTSFTLIGKLKARTKEEATARTVKLIEQHRPRFKTITADNGTEFHGYKDVELATDVKFYFATPHHSWERGTNENTNGLIRQYLPKRQSMKEVTQHQCHAIAEQLNTRPRKKLAYRTPREALYGY